RGHRVPGEGAPKRRRRSLVEEDFHAAARRASARRLGQAPARMLQDGFDLFPGDALEPLEELVHAGAALEVLEEGADGNAGALEEPRAAHLAWDALHGGALTPVEHGRELTTPGVRPRSSRSARTRRRSSSSTGSRSGGSCTSTCSSRRTGST